MNIRSFVGGAVVGMPWASAGSLAAQPYLDVRLRSGGVRMRDRFRLYQCCGFLVLGAILAVLR